MSCVSSLGPYIQHNALGLTSDSSGTPFLSFTKLEFISEEDYILRIYPAADNSYNMSKSVLCALLVLLLDMSLPFCAEGAGEYCHGWSDSSNTWHRGFHCPEQYDGEDARYCCGTCTLRYCCTSVEARLDQSTCDPDDFINNSNGKVRTMTPNGEASGKLKLVFSLHVHL